MKVPRIVFVRRRPRPAALALAMNVRRLDAEPLADLVKRNTVPMNAERRAEVKVVRFVRLLASEKAPQRAESS